MAEAKAESPPSFRRSSRTPWSTGPRRAGSMLDGIRGARSAHPGRGQARPRGRAGSPPPEDLATLRSYIASSSRSWWPWTAARTRLLRPGTGRTSSSVTWTRLSDGGLACGAEGLVVQRLSRRTGPWLARVKNLGLSAVVCPARGTSEDVAAASPTKRRLPDRRGWVTHNTLDEFLDKGRAGYSSKFLTGCGSGGKLVDAKGVSRLYRPRVSGWALMALGCRVGHRTDRLGLFSYGPDIPSVPQHAVGRGQYWLTGLF